MNRKLIYTFSLIGFFLMWGVFGFVAGVPRGETRLQETLPPVESTPVPPQSTDLAQIPVTGESEPLLMEVVLFYGLIGLTALFLVFGLLTFANRSTAADAQQDDPSTDEKRKN